MDSTGCDGMATATTSVSVEKVGMKRNNSNISVDQSNVDVDKTPSGKCENDHQQQSIVIPVTPSHNTPLSYGIMPSWDDEPLSIHICRICKKTFYNANALQNHKNTQHDGEASSEPEYHVPAYYDDKQTQITGFKFIPNPLADTSSDSVHDGLTTRIFSENTTYIILQVEGDMSDKQEKQAPPKSPVQLKGPFICAFPSPHTAEKQCRQIFLDCCDYSVHYRDNHTKRRKAALRCQVCEKRLDRDFNLTESLDVQMQAANQVVFSCRTCGQTFLDSNQYDEHNRIVHAKMKPHHCPLCAKRFTQQGGLQQHMRMHSGVRPYVCSFCSKGFTQKGGLDQHLRIHTKVKPFRCVICTKTFSQSVHLRQHMRTHTNIQPFECSVCRRKFKQSSHLNFHMRSHVSDGSLPLESYAKAIREQNHLEFLNLSNLQPVQDGETLYYAAEIAPNEYGFESQNQTVFPKDILDP